MAGAQGFVAVVGARVLPETAAPPVADTVRFFLSRRWGIGSCGAGGACRPGSGLTFLHFWARSIVASSALRA
jgi:hypothetical protein